MNRRVIKRKGNGRIKRSVVTGPTTYFCPNSNLGCSGTRCGYLFSRSLRRRYPGIVGINHPETLVNDPEWRTGYISLCGWAVFVKNFYLIIIYRKVILNKSGNGILKINGRTDGTIVNYFWTFFFVGWRTLVSVVGSRCLKRTFSKGNIPCSTRRIVSIVVLWIRTVSSPTNTENNPNTQHVGRIRNLNLNDLAISYISGMLNFCKTSCCIDMKCCPWNWF